MEEQNRIRLVLDENLFLEADLTADRLLKCSLETINAEIRKGELPYSGFVKYLADTYVVQSEKENVRILLSATYLLGSFRMGNVNLSYEVPVSGEDGNRKWVRIAGQLYRSDENGHTMAFILMNDATDEIGEEIRLKHLAEMDSLTGIYHRGAMEKRIREIMAKKGKRCALLMIDLDNLKGINDGLGHIRGDEALKAVAETLKDHFRKTDVVGRIGGDEFIAFLSDISSSASLRNTLTSFIEKVNRHLIGDNNFLRTKCSIGCAFGVTGQDSYEKMYQEADCALYHVKQNGKNDYAFYSPEMERDDYHYLPHSGITITHTEWYEESEYRKLLLAISKFFPLVISVNLTKNTYYMMEYDKFITHKSKEVGVFDELISSAADMYHPDDRAAFAATFSRENLLKAFREGHDSVSFEGKQMGDDGVYRTIRSHAIFMKDAESGDICEICLTRPLQ